MKKKRYADGSSVCYTYSDDGKLTPKWDERSDLPSQFMGTKMTETRSDAYGYNARSELTNVVKMSQSKVHRM